MLWRRSLGDRKGIRPVKNPALEISKCFPLEAFWGPGLTWSNPKKKIVWLNKYRIVTLLSFWGNDSRRSSCSSVIQLIAAGFDRYGPDEWRWLGTCDQAADAYSRKVSLYAFQAWTRECVTLGKDVNRESNGNHLQRAWAHGECGRCKVGYQSKLMLLNGKQIQGRHQGGQQAEPLKGIRPWELM